jgi:hypothetical protein
MINKPLARLLVALIVLTAGGCVTPKATYAPDGRKGYVVTCGGFLDNYSSCLVAAGRACGARGYDTVRGGPDDREMLIACKTPP